MINSNYSNAYTEVLTIINTLKNEDYEKIPKEYIEYLRNNCNEDHKFEYNTAKLFSEQDLLDETKYILFGLFEKFGSTENQKVMIKNFRTNYYNKLESQKRERYSAKEIFNNRKLQEDDKSKTENIEEQDPKIQLVEYKESFFNKLKSMIFKLLH